MTKVTWTEAHNIHLCWAGTDDDPDSQRFLGAYRWKAEDGSYFAERLAPQQRWPESKNFPTQAEAQRWIEEQLLALSN